MLHSLALPPYSDVRYLEGHGNYAVLKYYKWPYRFFYRHKLKMMLSLMPRKRCHNILDFGAGQGIFTPELKKRASFVRGIDKGDEINFKWKFDLIVCGSVLEFVSLPGLIKVFRHIIRVSGRLIVASPMDTKLSRFYFKSIGDKHQRHGHELIKKRIRRCFSIEEYKEWLGLYFALRARPK